MARMALVALLAFCALFQLTAAALPNCSYPAIFAFGDSLTDTGNSIAAFPEVFKEAELDPMGQEFPMHAADRYTDGKLLLDFLAFGVRRRPIYPFLRSVGAPLNFGTNFAAYGGSARPVKVWKKGSGFNSPFSLDVQLEWMHRYEIRVWFYENPTFNPPSRAFVQGLPTLASFSDSLFLVYAGYQDYFFSLYEQKLTIKQTHMIVDDVVKAIKKHIKGMFKPYLYIPPDFPSFYLPTPREVMVVNMPPLGCIPALLTQFAGKGKKLHYDKYGCITELNDISKAHNWKLNEAVKKLRSAYPSKKIVLADNYAVYYDILANPSKYGVTDPLKACCGKGGPYNFNKKVTCGHAGIVEGKFVNLTMTLPVQPCKNLSAVLSWDGIHTSNTFNKAAATAFLTGQHVTPAGGLNCSPDFFFFPFRT